MSSITIEVSLISGRTVVVETELDATVESLKQQAQTALGVGRGRLSNAAGEVLDGTSTIKHCGLCCGDLLTLQIGLVQVASSSKAAAAILGDGHVVTWGDPPFGDSSSLQDQLRNVWQIQTTDGGVQDQLKDVQQIQASYGAFAAILADGSVVTWGDSYFGGNSTNVQDQLKDVRHIQASKAAFAAIRSDGSVVTWGDVYFGGNSSAAEDPSQLVQGIHGVPTGELNSVRQIQSAETGKGGNNGAVRDRLKDVCQLQASRHAFAAILGDGSVVTWGDSSSGGDSSAVQYKLKDVQSVQATDGAFAAILGSGFVVTWGQPDLGGDSSSVQDRLMNVQQVQACRHAFAAILSHGTVVAWGGRTTGGDCRNVQDKLEHVEQIASACFSFAAILRGGSVVTWGDVHGGGSSCEVRHLLHDVQCIRGFQRAFAAIRADGSVVTWGHADPAGDSTAVKEQLLCPKEKETRSQGSQGSDPEDAAVLAYWTLLKFKARLDQMRDCFDEHQKQGKWEGSGDCLRDPWILSKALQMETSIEELRQRLVAHIDVESKRRSASKTVAPLSPRGRNQTGSQTLVAPALPIPATVRFGSKTSMISAESLSGGSGPASVEGSKTLPAATASVRPKAGTLGRRMVPKGIEAMAPVPSNAPSTSSSLKLKPQDDPAPAAEKPISPRGKVPGEGASQAPGSTAVVKQKASSPRDTRCSKFMSTRHEASFVRCGVDVGNAQALYVAASLWRESDG
eukprot:s3574_g5.t1